MRPGRGTRRRTRTGQREREQRAYHEMLDQMRLADEVGFNIAWFVEHHFREGRSHCPAPEVVIGALDPGHREHPARLRRDAAAVRLHAPGPGRREGGDGRHPVAGSGRVGHRPVDADGADRVPRRPRGEPRRVGGGHRDHRARCGATSTSSGTARRSSSRGGSSRPSRSRTRIRRAGWRRRRRARRRSRAPTARPAVVLDHAAAREDGGTDRGVPRGLEQPEAKPITDVATNKVAAYTLVHCAETNEQADDNGIWESVALVVPEHRRVHPRSGSSPTSRTAEDVRQLPAAQAAHGGQHPHRALRRRPT